MTVTATGNDSLETGERLTLHPTRDRRIWITLAIALLVHSLLLASFIRSPPRMIGDPNGDTQAVDVSFVTEAELQSQFSPQSGAPSPMPPAPAPAPPEPQAQSTPPPPEPAPPEPPEPAPAEPVPDLPAVEPAPPEQPAAEKAPPEPKAETAEAKAADTVEQLKSEEPDLLAFPDPQAKAEPAPQQETGKQARKDKSGEPPAKQPSQKQKMAKREPLDLSLPRQPMMEPSLSGGGGAAGFERPPGTTQSGANDTFARGVIRALRETMPQLSNVRGRVTVRIVLNDNGNLDTVTVVSPSEVAELTRSVVFSTKQANYPIPPGGSNMADKTFTVTYIYR